MEHIKKKKISVNKYDKKIHEQYKQSSIEKDSAFS